MTASEMLTKFGLFFVALNSGCTSLAQNGVEWVGVGKRAGLAKRRQKGQREKEET